METRARMTSKGQVTVPIEVRRSLGIEEGDVVVFELAGAYATLRKRRPTLEVTAEVRERYLGGRELPSITNREAIEAHFSVKKDAQPGDVVYVSSGDGTFVDAEAPQADTDDPAR